jgi:UDPglucose 6-dehydrogenase
VGADVHHVAKGMGLDRRIGQKFLHPGPGYGGSCFPKDTRALLEVARQHDSNVQIVEAAIRVNERQRKLCLEKILDMFDGDISGKAIGVLGLSFKPETDDIREAPAIDIIQALVSKGARIRTFDPVAMDNCKELFPDLIYCNDPYNVSEGSDVLVFITEWNQFRKLDMVRIKTLLKAPNIVDLRNIYEPSKMNALGFKYVCVGR